MTALVKIPEKNALESSDVLPAMSWADMLRMGDQLVKSGLLPDHIRTGAQAAAVMLTGRELGMAPMRALRSLQVVKGKVIESADSQLARFKSCGGRARFVTLDDAVAELELTHPNGDRHVERFTLEDAKRARLTGEAWQKFPRAMLRSRAITAGLKSLGFEGSVGAYDPDEAKHFVEESPSPPPPVAANTNVSAAPRGASILSREERLLAKELMNQLGITEDYDGYVRDLNGGELPTSVEELANVIDELRRRVEARASQASNEG